MESEDSQCTLSNSSDDELSRDSSCAATKGNTADTQDDPEESTQGIAIRSTAPTTTDTRSNSSSSSKSNSSSSSSSSISSDSEDDAVSSGRQGKNVVDNCENSNKTVDGHADAGGHDVGSSNNDHQNKRSRTSSSSSSTNNGSSSNSSSSDEGEANENEERPAAPPSSTSIKRNSSNSTSPGKIQQQSPNSRQSFLSSIRSEHSNSPFNNENGTGTENENGNNDEAAAAVAAINDDRDAIRDNSHAQPLNHHHNDINISHEDLSDVSDLESEKRNCSVNNDEDDDDDDVDDVADDDEKEEGALSDDSTRAKKLKKRKNSNGDKKQQHMVDGKNDNGQGELRGKIDLRKKELKKHRRAEDDVKKSHHEDDSLDFEAEEGECHDTPKEDGEVENVHDGVKNGDGDEGGIANNEKILENASDTDAAKSSSKKQNDIADETNADGEDSGGNNDNDVKKSSTEAGQVSDGGEDEVKEELEEGEVTDEDEKRPEETEPKPICRFYTRGQCTWGMSCRFLHPGVTDKGNYTMFESMVRSVPMPQGGGTTPRPPTNSYGGNHPPADYHDYRSERPPIHHRPPMHHPYASGGSHHDSRALLPEVPVVVENAWERGLRTAKEMMRKANKRKEQDMDFEDKKMNLTLSPDDMDKDPYYSKERGSSPTNYAVYSPQDRYSRGGPQYMGPYEDVDAYGRMTRYRELPPHRMPQYEDDRRLRPTREVIVQRVETGGRGDEWNDPWMRSKSPGGRSGSYDRDERRRRDRGRSYSSNSSYSSSNSSQSDSSTDSSRSSRSVGHKRRYGGAGGNSHSGGSHKLPPSSRRHLGNSSGASGAVGGRNRSPSLVGRRGRRSPSSVSPVNYKRGALDKRSAYSPSAKRRKMISSPTTRKSDKARRRHSSSSSDSDSSGSSYSDSDSGSSSSDSSSASKNRGAMKARARGTDKALTERSSSKQPLKKVDETTIPIKKRSPISIEIKKPATVGVSALAASPTHSTVSDKDSNNSKEKKSRREELLKQLRAVEDAIAKKRSKLA